MPSRIADLKFKKRPQLFICAHNEALTVAAMCVCNRNALYFRKDETPFDPIYSANIRFSIRWPL
jgi:hypothetical protein